MNHFEDMWRDIAGLRAENNDLKDDLLEAKKAQRQAESRPEISGELERLKEELSTSEEGRALCEGRAGSLKEELGEAAEEAVRLRQERLTPSLATYYCIMIKLSN